MLQSRSEPYVFLSLERNLERLSRTCSGCVLGHRNQEGSVQRRSGGQVQHNCGISTSKQLRRRVTRSAGLAAYLLENGTQANAVSMRVRVAPAPLEERRISTHLHPMIDLCNSVSRAFATPVAVFDISRIAEYIEVRYASGSEVYATFAGEIENPEPREVILAGGLGTAHARRWSHRQSGYSAVRWTRPRLS
jgi:hypothetical protein